MASLTFTDVCKSFDGVEALRGLSFEVLDGEFFVILGPSRSGKSTILRTAAGLEIPDAGRVQFDAEDMTGRRPGDRNVGMFFQNYALYPNKNGFENIAAGLRVRRLPKGELDARVGEVARLLRVEHLLDRKPSTYSGGEQQRVAIGRAIARQARLYFFDEPLSNLDALVRLRLRGEFKRLQRELGMTFVYVTPDQVEALSLADRIMVLVDGRVEQIATPTEIYRAPANAFVAAFVGSPPMNVLPGRIDREGSRQRFSHASGGSIEIEPPGPGIVLGDVQLGVRPEHLDLAPDESSPLRVQAVESLGRRKLIHIGFGEDDCLVLQPPDSPFRHGQRVRLTSPLKSVHAFDLDSGHRLGGAA